MFFFYVHAENRNIALFLLQKKQTIDDETTFCDERVLSSILNCKVSLKNMFFALIISRVSDQNGVSPLYIILEIYHSGRKPSI